MLTGFMGSGKTTVGRLLASRLGWAFADLDDAVAQGAGLSVPQIFAEQGEAAFRAHEVKALHTLLQQTEIVIALGGGAPGTAAVRALLRDAENTAVVYLEASFPVLYERCTLQASDPRAIARPLLGSREAASRRFAQRAPLYASLASWKVQAGLPSPEHVTDSILRSLQAELPSLPT